MNTHPRRRARKKPKRSNPLVFRIIVGVLLAAMAALLALILIVSLQLPSVSSLNNLAPIESSIIYSSDGTVLGTIHGDENRITVPLSSISPYLIKAVIASEDSDFYHHKGVSFKAIVRAVIVNIVSGRKAQGGSTITQQLARTLFLSNKKTFARKLTEMALAIELEKRFTKDEILEMYLNQVFWGHNTFGADAASQVFFGKHADSLTLGEASLMAGILSRPEKYSPYKNFALAMEIRSSVLNKMKRLGMISDKESREADKEKINLSMEKINKYKFNAPYFTTYVINQLIDKYGRDIVYKGGLRIHTSLFMPLQKIAEETVDDFITKEGTKYRFGQAAMVALDPNTGYILAMVGGANIDKSEYNRVTQAKRSPGSSFKVFVYTAALERGMISPGDIVDDTPVTFDVYPDSEHPDGKWRPNNFDKKFRGPVTIRYALENSLNIPALRVLQLVGADHVVDLAQRMGIRSPLQPNLSLALGTSDVNLLEMTSAYGVLATQGIKNPPVSITRVTDHDGKVLEEVELSPVRVIEPEIANIMIDMMKGVINSGTGRRAKISRPAAAKTGTSQSFKDAWFIGFVPQLAAGVWVGNDNNRPMTGVAEVGVCPRMWKAFMDKALADVPVEDFNRPMNMIGASICTISGKLATSACPPNKVKWAAFVKGKEPRSSCDIDHSSQDPSPAQEDFGEEAF